MDCHAIRAQIFDTVSLIVQNKFFTITLLVLSFRKWEPLCRGPHLYFMLRGRLFLSSQLCSKFVFPSKSIITMLYSTMNKVSAANSTVVAMYGSEITRFNKLQDIAYDLVKRQYPGQQRLELTRKVNIALKMM